MKPIHAPDHEAGDRRRAGAAGGRLRSRGRAAPRAGRGAVRRRVVRRARRSCRAGRRRGRAGRASRRAGSLYLGALALRVGVHRARGRAPADASRRWTGDRGRHRPRRCSVRRRARCSSTSGHVAFLHGADALRIAAYLVLVVELRARSSATPTPTTVARRCSTARSSAARCSRRVGRCSRTRRRCRARPRRRAACSARRGRSSRSSCSRSASGCSSATRSRRGCCSSGSSRSRPPTSFEGAGLTHSTGNGRGVLEISALLRVLDHRDRGAPAPRPVTSTRSSTSIPRTGSACCAS